jgi:ankyrin repeat protein
MYFETFCHHAADGRLADVQRMLESNELPVTRNPNTALELAAMNGHDNVVDYFIRHAMLDPSADSNYAIRTAAGRGYLAVVERLLQDERVDPSAENDCAVRWAARNGHLAVVERLLRDARVDPSADDNFAVRRATENGHLAVVDRLLEDDRVDAAVAMRHSLPPTPQTIRVSRTLDRDLRCAARFGVAGVDHSPDSRRRSSVVDTAASQQVELGVRGQALSR